MVVCAGLGSSQPSQPLSQSGQGIPVPAGGSNPFLEERQNSQSVTGFSGSCVNLGQKRVLPSLSDTVLELESFRGSSVILVGKLKCHS